ncbi:MAG: LysR substrate-binding domain-containing protein [Pseudomonadota bacterium]
MSRRPPVASLRAFEAAARHASFSAAAEELSLTPAAVSQQIRVLEAHLGAVLFERLPRGVKLTEQGAAYAQPVRKAFAEMQGATEALFGTASRRRVNARASISCAALVVAPRLFEFQALRPDIEVRLSTFVWADGFGDGDADLDIRFGHGDWSDGRVTHLGHETALPVCSPDHAAALSAPTIEALAAGPVIEIAGSEADWAAIAEHNGVAAPAPTQVQRVDSSLVALQMAINGPGAVIVLESFAREYMRLGLLVAPCEARLPIQPSHFIVQRPRARAPEAAQAFADWVRSLY